MFVCNCNGITETEVKTAVRSGVESWDDVHAFYGCEPCCGKCQCEIVETIVEHQQAEQADEGGIFGLPVFEGAD